ncbi:MAG: hypothetical protein CMP48_16285 [Rickettsiales bacterium]|nr:hypothetical protein [Rickettsiales bacterium]
MKLTFRSKNMFNEKTENNPFSQIHYANGINQSTKARKQSDNEVAGLLHVFADLFTVLID